MKTKKITELEMEPLRIASLPTRPTADTSFGGKGYSSTQMKEAFDKLPELIAERVNSLLDDISCGDVADDIPTDNPTVSTLRALFDGIENGDLIAAIKMSGESVSSMIAKLRADVNALEKKIEQRT